GRNYRLFQIETAGNSAEPAVRHCRTGAACGSDLKIISCAECALTSTCHDRDPLLRIGGEFIEDFAELHMGRRMKRVQHLGPIESNDRQSFLALDLTELVIGHETSSHC